MVIDGAEARGVRATSAHDAWARCVPAPMPSATALVILAAILSSRKLAFSLLSRTSQLKCKVPYLIESVVWDKSGDLIVNLLFFRVH